MNIDIGIHLGSSSASVAQVVDGEVMIIKSDTLKDSIPMCVYINKKEAILVGDKAFNIFRTDNATKDWNESNSNGYIEFTRTIGTDKLYFSSNASRSFTSEELVAEILKCLLSFVKDKWVKSAVITVPANFKNNQKAAVREAANLAGLRQVELIQESVAVSIAYGLSFKKKDGYWLVFDFGKGTFNATLLKAEDGIMKVADTEGDSYLGGKNLDLAIVDEIILPYLQKNYTIDSIVEDDNKKQILRNSVKFYAEEAKIKSSNNELCYIISDFGDIPGEDDDGEEFELDITVTQNDMQRVFGPIFQKSIDISKKLLERNNLTGSNLESLILVGGNTFSPVLRKMLEEQICKPDTSVDPMTVVTKGAALYGSTIAVSDEFTEQSRDRSKIHIEIGHETSTVEIEEFVTLKILTDKTEGTIPEKVFAEITRCDKTWSSGKVEINEIGEVIETQLLVGKTNSFEVTLYNDKGNMLESEPKEFTIIQDHKIGSASLAYNIGIEIKKQDSDKIVFSTISGLEKNKSLPTVGIRNGIKTDKPIRPGISSDFIKIPLFEGEHNAEGTRTIYNEHITDIIISGADLPTLLPENSDIDLMISVDKSEKITVTAYFPYLDYSCEVRIARTVSSIETNWLLNEIRKAKGTMEELKDDNVTTEKVQKLQIEILELEKNFEINKNDIDGKQEVLTNLRRILKKIDEISEAAEWPKLEEELKQEFYRLDKANTDFGNDKTTQIVNQVGIQLEEVIKSQDPKLGTAFLAEITNIKLQINKDNDLFLPEVAETLSASEIENLLFNLALEKKISSEKFQIIYDLLQEESSSSKLIEINTELKSYE